MKLLIVDDQASVVEGLLKGIRWDELGMEKVYTALNALEARNILNKETIDIMLCDIEMPVESGLQLYEWMNKKGFVLMRCPRAGQRRAGGCFSSSYKIRCGAQPRLHILCLCVWVTCIKKARA